MQYMTGRALYEKVVCETLGSAKVSVWIATANLKELLVAPPRGTRAHASGKYISVVEVFEGLAARGVELRILHSGVPSGPLSRELVKRRGLLRPARMRNGAEGAQPLALRRCPRVHFKAVVVDGARVYLGSANWTGAGLGAKGDGRRNFEVGFLSEDDKLLDDVQALFDRVWSGRECGRCRLRSVCPAPLDGTPG